MSKYDEQATLADNAFAEYDFGDGVMVTDTSGWEYTTPGNERTRKVYIETESEDDGPAPRWVLNFTVRFDPDTGSLSEAYALDNKGQVWGAMPSDRTNCSEEMEALGFKSVADYHSHQSLLSAMKSMAAQQKADSIAAGSTAFQPQKVKVSTEQLTATAHGGQYKIRVPLKALLDATQVKSLVAALQRSFDDGTAGLFEVASTEQVSVVVFYREMSDDLEVIQANCASNLITASDPTEAVVEQLAMELAEHQDESPYVQELVTAMRELGSALLDAGGDQCCCNNVS